MYAIITTFTYCTNQYNQGTVLGSKPYEGCAIVGTIRDFLFGAHNQTLKIYANHFKASEPEGHQLTKSIVALAATAVS
jgi:hypothetical protein